MIERLIAILTGAAGSAVTLPEICETLQVSPDHLRLLAHRARKVAAIDTVRGIGYRLRVD